MAMYPVRWRVKCDHPEGCSRYEESGNYFRFIDRLDAEGWQRSVKLNGERAVRGGKDYCPEHRRSTR
jgi:hypothetical protein